MTDQLQFHLAFARRHGVTDAELQEALLHLAFYAGWPHGMGATAVLLAPLADGSAPLSNVTFEPTCRNHWHVHHGTDGGGDQILICTAGSGWYQADGREPVSMEPGTVVRVPAGTKHWHDAKADSWFSHLAYITPGTDVGNEWLEPVADEVYAALPHHGECALPGPNPRPFNRLLTGFGSIRSCMRPC